MRFARVLLALLPGSPLHRWFLIPLALLMALSGCGGDDPSKPVVVNLEPSTATVEVNQTQQFTATVTGVADTTVMWSVDGGASNGTITTSGLYTAPTALPNPDNPVTVRATSVADPSKMGTAIVTLFDLPPVFDD